jgi:hypothetical protein
MKTTCTDDGADKVIRYPLKKKNYNDLTLRETLAPRILVLITLPSEVREWLSLTQEQLVLRRCGYWLSLAGKAERDNETAVTVYVPRENLMTPGALRRMMHTISETGTL